MPTRRVLAILAAAGLVTISAAGPAAATGGHPERTVTVQKVDFTQTIPAGEACTFPVTVTGVGTTRIVEQGDEVWTYNKADSFFTVRNLQNGRQTRLSAKGGFYDRVQPNGDLRTRAWGNTFYFTSGDPANPETGGFELAGSSGAAPGMLYIQGRARFTVTDPADSVRASFHFEQVKGTATSVCSLVD